MTSFISRNLWGIFLVTLGVWWLLGDLGLVPFEWSIAGPLAIVVVGVSMFLGAPFCSRSDA